VDIFVNVDELLSCFCLWDFTLNSIAIDSNISFEMTETPIEFKTSVVLR
jgi:hypothetical protein